MSEVLNAVISMSSVVSQVLSPSKKEGLLSNISQPKKLYLLVDAQGNDLTEGEPLSHHDLVSFILDGAERDYVTEFVLDQVDYECCVACNLREYAIEALENNGYRIIEVLR